MENQLRHMVRLVMMLDDIIPKIVIQLRELMEELDDA